jgi:hypothetical protein
LQKSFIFDLWLTTYLSQDTHCEMTISHGKVHKSTFGDGQVSVIANMGTQAYEYNSKRFGKVTLPPYGFIVEAQTFVAFHAKSFNGLDYENAPCLRFGV